MPLWFCLKTEPKREHIAAAGLRQMEGMDVLAPRIRYRKATRRGQVWFVEPMFPGYVFAQFLFSKQQREVQYVHGVTNILAFGDRVGVVDPGAIAELRKATGNEEMLVYAPSLQVGDTVEITDGALQGLQGVITRLLPGRDRVRVLLDFLGRQIEADATLPKLLSTESPRSVLR